MASSHSLSIIPFVEASKLVRSEREGGGGKEKEEIGRKAKSKKRRKEIFEKGETDEGLINDGMIIHERKEGFSV